MWNSILSQYQASQEALRQKFEEGDWETLERQRVGVKQSNGHTKFKYRAGCNFFQDYMLSCRGTTRMADGRWIFSAMKFFNRHELHRRMRITPEELWDAFSAGEFEMEMSLKLDGSNVQVTWLEDRFHITTLGSLEEQSMAARIQAPSFAQSCQDLIGPAGMEVIRSHPEMSFVFELCTQFNPVITKYTADFARLLYLVDLSSGMTVHVPEIVEKLRDVGVGMPPCWSLDPTKGWQQVDRALKMLPHVQEYGENPEGVCLYLLRDGYRFPFVKVKREEYLECLGGKQLQIGSIEDRHLVELAVLKELDDDLSHEVQQQHATLFRTSLEQLLQRIQTLTKTSYNGKAEFARALAQSDLPEWIRPFLFQTFGKKIHWKALADWLLEAKQEKPRLNGFQKKTTLEKAWFQT